MQNKRIRVGPFAMQVAATNVYNPPATSGGVPSDTSGTKVLIKHIRIVNTNASPRTFSLFVGATAGSAAGTEVMGGTQNVAGNSAQDYYPTDLVLGTTDFLTQTASATGLTLLATGELGVSG